MTCFLESVEFPRDYSPGLSGGPMFSTVKVVSQTGQEQRIRQWTKGRWKCDVPNLLRSKAQAEKLLALFQVTGGSQCGFRFFDWMDHDSTFNFVEFFHDTLMLTSTTFQLQKIYTIAGVTYARPIKKPISDTLGDMAAAATNSTVRVYNAGAEVTSGWTVDCTTGILTFDSAPGYLPQAQFQYHIPMRFQEDEISIEQVNPVRYNLSKVSLVEQR